MKTTLSLAGAFLFAAMLGLGVGAYAAENDNLGASALCKKCAGKGFITNIGTCGECARDTSSGAFNLCQACARKLGKCQACGAALPAPAEKKPEDPVKADAGEVKKPLTEFAASLMTEISGSFSKDADYGR